MPKPSKRLVDKAFRNLIAILESSFGTKRISEWVATVRAIAPLWRATGHADKAEAAAQKLRSHCLGLAEDQLRSIAYYKPGTPDHARVTEERNFYLATAETKL